MDQRSEQHDNGYARNIADASFEWYQRAATKSRKLHQGTAASIQIVAAAIPVAAVLSPQSALVPAVLGAVIVILTGLRSIFDWQENYIRFSGAREAVEAERRRYLTGAEPYADPSARDQKLVAAVTRIEQQEMKAWFKVVEDRQR
ncbi:DUF4231 domain-containing protein [Actinoplanes sp. G11-F43]|uniref:DUF4231 domain-containing protein n=1 Tax=Actinoplanes sp. G11-F43 TaxID=3424130 RepID=UPI003D33E7EE